MNKQSKIPVRFSLKSTHYFIIGFTITAVILQFIPTNLLHWIGAFVFYLIISAVFGGPIAILTLSLFRIDFNTPSGETLFWTVMLISGLLGLGLFEADFPNGGCGFSYGPAFDRDSECLPADWFATWTFQ